MTLESQYKIFIEKNPDKAHWVYDAWLEWHSKQLSESIEKIQTPYCSECEACGEEGCCSALNCKHSENGSYCEAYLRDLRFGYYMSQWAEKNLIKDLSSEQQAKYNEEWDKTYDKFYKT